MCIFIVLDKLSAQLLVEVPHFVLDRPAWYQAPSFFLSFLGIVVCEWCPQQSSLAAICRTVTDESPIKIFGGLTLN
jgi:hypothetical protein